MPAVHDPNGHLAQPLHAPDVVGDVRLGELVQQDAALVDAVAGEQRPRRLLPQADLARRVTGEVQDREPSVAEIDLVALVDDARRRHGRDGVGAELEPLVRQRGEQRRRWVVARELLGRVVLDPERGEPVRVRDRLCVVAVHHDLLELVQPAGVVEVPVRRHGDHGAFEQVGELPAQRPDPEPRVHQDVPVAPPDEEQVRLQERVDVRLADPQDAVVDGLVLEPSLGHTHARDASGLT